MLIAKDLLKGDIQLASPPVIYLTLNKIIDDPTKNVRDAAYVIESDAALAARLLKIVNSAFYGFPSKIDSISTAITLIGTRELRNLALATIVIERFSDLPGRLFSMNDYWARNLSCALIARELDAQTGKVYGDTAFLCGLLHNIGRLVFYRRIPDLAREADLLIQEQGGEGCNEAEVEQRVMGFDRFEVGAELCRLWKLPDVVVESIRLHSYPDDAGCYSAIANIARTAHLFSRADQFEQEKLESGLWLSAEQILALLNKVSDEFTAIFKLFYPAQ